MASAGADWSDVVAVDSFHIPAAPDSVGDDHNRVMVEQFRKRMGDRAPIWTQIGVSAPGALMMRVEIRATAVVPARQSSG
ncbi:Rid family hydrolase [Mycolicibacterium litorale]|uniref:Rid family hydrolase n=1 Tax=Mycolicibacterium litorale TaxID=758802 RepID=UPI001623AC1A|nr:Rid family hydrolase [Mycolicibacterium litorale]